MKRSMMMGFMLLSVLLALSSGVYADNKEDLLRNIKSLSTTPEVGSRLKLDLTNTSINEAVLANLTAHIKPELENITFPDSETIAGNTANEPTSIIVVQNVSLNIILIQNLTEITNAVIPLSMNNATKNMTNATKNMTNATKNMTNAAV
jgi:hypothetical protein